MSNSDYVQAVVSELFYSHGFAQEDIYGRRFFFHKKNVSRIGIRGWDDLRPGSIIRLLPNESPKGWEALEVSIVQV